MIAFRPKILTPTEVQEIREWLRQSQLLMVRQYLNDMAAVATAQVGRFTVGDKETDPDEDQVKDWTARALGYAQTSELLGKLSEPDYVFEISEITSVLVVKPTGQEHGRSNLQNPTAGKTGINPTSAF